jgi:hypothetical protein
MCLSLTVATLQGYGHVPEQLGQYLDPVASELAEVMNAITRLFTENGGEWRSHSFVRQ